MSLLLFISLSFAGLILLLKPLTDTGEACVWIRDQGQGIREEDQERIFNRFYRVNTGTGSQSKGLGLGLYISNEIVTRHGGHMWLESKPGEGSTFYFSFQVSIQLGG